MKKIIYKTIKDDKNDLILIINKMIPLYKKLEFHTQVLECEHWITELNKKIIKIEYTSDEIFMLKNILMDCSNIFLSYSNYEVGELSMKLMFKINELFN